MKIALLGDVALFGRFCVNHNPDVYRELEGLRDYLAHFDLVVANLETPFAEGGRTGGVKSAHLYSAPNNVDILRFLGIDCVTLANNHMGDFGQSSFELTCKLLDDAGIDWYGAGGKVLFKEFPHARLALHGYCAFNTNPLLVTADEDVLIDALDVDTVVNRFDDCRAKGFLNLLSIHSGQEHVLMPDAMDVRFARLLAKRAPYIYHGHHPHVIQGAECLQGAPIFYSLGNALFDDVYTPKDKHRPLVALSERNRIGGIGVVTVEDNCVKGWSLETLYLGENAVSVSGDSPGIDSQALDALLADAGTETYEEKRAEAIRGHINSRKEIRDINWYLKRMRPASFFLILAARSNARRQKHHFTSKVAQYER